MPADHHRIEPAHNMLWDALTGRIYHWNKTKERLHCNVCTALAGCDFAPERVHTLPGSNDFLTAIRDRLYAYYFSATVLFDAELDRQLSPYRSVLFSLTTHQRGSLICALHIPAVAREFIQSSLSINEQLRFDYQTAGIERMYNKSIHYRKEWIDKLDWFADESRGDFRLMFKAYDEIAPILGLPENDTPQAMFWSGISTQIAKGVTSLYKDEDRWHGVVEAEITAAIS